MAYLVLARKYRPQTFADLTGQEHVVQTLTNALRTDRVAHALLFCGPRGCGKTTSARIVAKALNCVNGPTPDPCGQCAPCREIALGTNVDVQEIDAASNTGVDNVRELRESAKYLPARDRFKIFIVDEVHMLSKAAFNAFLKTLEEPPGHVKFLFATTDPQALPDTILSRCQRHNFRLVPLAKIVARLSEIAAAERVAIEPGALALVARQAAGSMRDALSILDQLFSSCGGSDTAITEADAAQALGALDHAVVAGLADALLQRDAAGVLQAVGRAYDGGHDLKRLAEDLATHLRNLIAVGLSGGPLDLPDHELRTLQAQAARADSAELARLFEIVHASLYEMSRAAQPRHALEIALLRAIHLAPADSVQGLLRRADELFRRLGGDPGVPPSGGGAGSRGRAPESGPGGRGAPAVRAHGPQGAQAVARAFPTTAPAELVARADVAPVQTPPVERHLSIVPTVEEPVATGTSSQDSRTTSARQASDDAQPPREIAQAPTRSDEPAPLSIEQWADLVARVREDRPLLASCLTHAVPLGWEGTVLRLGVERDGTFARTLSDEKQELALLLSKALGQTLSVEIVPLAQTQGQAMQTLADAQDEATREALAERLRLGREHPSILRAAAVLGADIDDVRDLGDAE